MFLWYGSANIKSNFLSVQPLRGKIQAHFFFSFFHCLRLNNLNVSVIHNERIGVQKLRVTNEDERMRVNGCTKFKENKRDIKI